MVRRTDSARAGTVLAVVAVAALALAVPGPALGSNHATVTVSDVSVTAGETATATVSLTEAPSGLSGFNVSVSVQGDAVSITDVATPGTYGLSQASVSDDGTSANARGVDVQGNVESGAESVELATLTLSGERPGDATLSPTFVDIDDDDGAALDAATEDGTASVAAESTPTPSPSPTATATAADQSTGTTADGGTPAEASGQTGQTATATPTAGESTPTEGDGDSDGGSLSPLWLLGGGGIVAAGAALTRLHFVWELGE